MEHYYDKIFGFFNFKDFYKDIVNKFPDGSHFVEIGGFLGCSSVFMAVEIINSGKKIKFDVVDKWNFTWELDGKTIQTYDTFIYNIYPVRHIVNPIQGDSKIIADNYEDESLDFVFIDGDHEYEPVLQDIKKWYPKVKKGGIISGHDYIDAFPGVIRAVREYFTEYSINGQCWSHKK